MEEIKLNLVEIETTKKSYTFFWIINLITVLAFSSILIKQIKDYKIYKIKLEQKKKAYHSLINNFKFIKKTYKNLIELKNNFTNLKKSLNSLMPVIAQASFSWTNFLTKIEKSIPENSYITGIELFKSGEEGNLKAKTDNIKKISKFIKNLKEKSKFEEVKLKFLKEFKHTINFQLFFKYKKQR